VQYELCIQFTLDVIFTGLKFSEKFKLKLFRVLTFTGHSRKQIVTIHIKTITTIGQCIIMFTFYIP